MSGADLWEDGYPHGTPEGFRGGCRGGACPAATEIGMSCRQADIWSHGNHVYRRMAAAGATPAEIAAAINHPATPEKTPMAKTITVDEPEPPAADVDEPTEDDVEEEDADAVDVPVDDDTDRPDPTEPELSDDSTGSGSTVSSDAEPTVLERPAAQDGLDKEQRKTIRAWALRNGIDVSVRGLLKLGVVAAYDRAHGKDLPPALEQRHTDTAPVEPVAEAGNDAPDELAGWERDLLEEGESRTPAGLADGTLVRLGGDPSSTVTPPLDADDATVVTGAAADTDTIEVAPTSAADELPPDNTGHSAKTVNKRIRAWARANGWVIGTQGRIQDVIVRAYLAAHPEDTDLTLLPAPATDEPMPAADDRELPTTFEQADTAAWSETLKDMHDAWAGENSAPRPEWADVTVSEDVEHARSLAARFEQEAARAIEQRDQALAEFAEVRRQLADAHVEVILLRDGVRRARKRADDLADVARAAATILHASTADERRTRKRVKRA